MVRWFRVTDPVSPLYGCDVRGRFCDAVIGERVSHVMVAEALRRIDVFVGDRPFQLTAPPGEDLGLFIDDRQLSPSPLQEDVIELGDDRPYGITIDESELTRPDGHTLRVVRYERAQQVALDDPMGRLLGSKTYYSADGTEGPEFRALYNAFMDERDADDLTSDLKRRD